MRRVGRGQYVCALADCDKELNEVTVKNQDPFCSTVCANVFHDFVPTSTMFTLGGTRTAGTEGRPIKTTRYDKKAWRAA